MEDEEVLETQHVEVEEETEESNVIDFHKEMQVNFDENDVEEIQNNEKMVFLVLYRRLCNEDMVMLMKFFALYSNSIISYLGK